MRKNGSRLISLQQYRLTDILLFAAILVAFDLIIHFAFIAYSGDYVFSLLVPIVLLVMMRWGWPCVFLAVGEGILYCVLNRDLASFTNWHYIIYGIGNAWIMLMLIPMKLVGKERICKSGGHTLWFTVLGWLLVYFGRCVMSWICGLGFSSIFFGQAMDLISLFIGVLLIQIFRKLDGMFEDQKHFLLRLDKERKDKMKLDTFGYHETEIDEESLAILKKDPRDYK